jgi:hypothetical protein
LIRLDEIEDPSPEEKELAELLTVLIDDYEERRYPIRKSSPRQTLHVSIWIDIVIAVWIGV